MLIKILDMNTRKGLFLVGAIETRETMTVTGYQLIYSLTCTNECVNAKLHNTGIFIKLENGEVIKYNVKPIDAKLKMAIRKKLAESAPVIEQPQIRVNEVPKMDKTAVKPRVKPKAITKTNAGTTKNKTVDIGSKAKEDRLKIYYMGTIFNSPKELCNKYGCSDVESFTKLYRQGYPVLMCLGKQPLDTTLKVIPREKQIDSYLKSSGNQN